MKGNIMHYCPNCDAEVSGKYWRYPRCCHNLYVEVAEDKPSIEYAILSAFFSTYGLILYRKWIYNYPQRAESCGKGAIIGLIVSTVVIICAVLILIMIM